MTHICRGSGLDPLYAFDSISGNEFDPTVFNFRIGSHAVMSALRRPAR
jgi:hypothetical protein